MLKKGLTNSRDVICCSKLHGYILDVLQFISTEILRIILLICQKEQYDIVVTIELDIYFNL